MIKNPILPGFYPDPSICRVEHDFYLVTSSFSYFPGVPVFHSRDLMHWEQIGHVLERKEQLHVTCEDISGGIFAPTIRYHEGVFYLITTNMTTHENFICTAADPAGPWSNPIVIKEASGIDPSLFFDEDGTVYFTGTSGFGDTAYDHQVIEISEIDPKTWQLVGKRCAIGDGALKASVFPEGPHLYKKDGWYYLLIAEGGTEHFHAVTVSRSKCLQEPFEQYIGNPILTHRHLGENYPVCNVGHADLVELADGSWYMVCLGSRLAGGYHKPLGRETFLVPVVWENGWPVASPGTGKAELSYPAPNLKEYAFTEEPETDDFEGDRLGMKWNYLGTPQEDFAEISDGRLWIRMLERNMVPWEFEGGSADFWEHMGQCGNTKKCMPFVGRRVTQLSFSAETVMEVSLKGKESAGVVLMQQNAHQLRFELMEENGGTVKAAVISARRKTDGGRIHYAQDVEGSVVLPVQDRYRLKIVGNENRYHFFLTAGGVEYSVAEQIDGSHLGSETAGGFVGLYFGLFATGNGMDSKNHAAFLECTYRS